MPLKILLLDRIYHSRTNEISFVLFQPSQMDLDDEDKYKRRSVLTWFTRWMRSRQSTSRRGSFTSNRSQVSRTRFAIYTIFAVLFVFVTILIVLYHFTRGDDNEHLDRIRDPQFNPLNNPFIRVGNRFVKNPSKDSIQAQSQ